MQNILVDQDGDFRCPSCHGRNFQHKRTLRGKVAAGAVVLPAALLVPKRMKCLVCGTYAKTDSAEQWRDPKLEPRRETEPSARVRQRPVDLSGEGETVILTITGSDRLRAAPLAAQLRELMPSLHYDKRARIAELVDAGERAFVAAVPSRAGAELVERLADIGVTAEIKPNK